MSTENESLTQIDATTTALKWIREEKERLCNRASVRVCIWCESLCAYFVCVCVCDRERESLCVWGGECVCECDLSLAPI